MPRSTVALAFVSVSALALVACNPRLPASQDAPDPNARAEAPPLNVDVIDRPDEVEPAPAPPTETPPDLTQVSNPDPTPPARPAPRPEPEDDLAPEVDHDHDHADASDEPELTRVSDGHCHADERTVYNCPFGDGRVVSVCAGPDDIAYRFGPLDDPELELLRDPAGEGVHYSVERRRGEGRQSQIRFENGNYDYIVYASGGGRRGRRGGPEESGVVVLHRGEVVNELQCPVASRQTALRVAMIRDDVPREEGRDRRWW
ncbi:hypothetical protein [Brevundimonas aveniformis]|uniref:hypothetical protein n=1 Tax=Brevundimonas aveniformis TaxID=370977 RepID=UPI00249232CD|nr:hypothetical protein [Brevundimonas aveniformis]